MADHIVTAAKLTPCVALLFAVGMALDAMGQSASRAVVDPLTQTGMIRSLSGRGLGNVEMNGLGFLANRRITRSSGVAFSRRRADVLWTHNDSGDRPNLFAFDLTCRDLGVFTVAGAEAIDWEDICSGSIDGTPCLIIADTGDNNKVRKSANLYVVQEPDLNLPGGAKLLETISFIYEDGPQNCEALALSPDEPVFYLVSKGDKRERKLYELQRDASPGQLAVARIVTRLDLPRVTAMDISRDGRYAVLLTENIAFEYQRAGGETWGQAFSRKPLELSVPLRQKGEAICYGPDSETLYLTSEGSPCPLWRIEILSQSPRP